MQPTGTRQGYYLTTINRLAIPQLILGILCFMNGVFIYIFYGLRMVDRGGLVEIWTEIWFIVAGATGIAVKTKQRCNVHMGFCIVATVMAAILAGEAGYYAIPRQVGYRLSFSSPHIPIFLLAVAEFIISNVASVYCCQVRPDAVSMATAGYVYPPGAVVIQHGMPQGGAVVTTPGTQHVVYQGAQSPSYPGYYGQPKI